MKKVLGFFAVCAAITVAAPAQDLPKLSEFLMTCARDQMQCSQKIKNYVEASKTQKIICLPDDVSVREGASATLSWLRSSDNVSDQMRQEPFDDALYEATTKLYPCKSEEEPQPPVPPPSADPAAAPPT
jgi:hypothetical protein